MDADSSYGGSDTAQDSNSAHELSTASSLAADLPPPFQPPHPDEDKVTMAVHVIGPPAPEDQPPQQFYHKNEITVPVNVDQTDLQRSPRLPHYLATAKLNISESLEHHNNLEEMSRNYRSSSKLNESVSESGNDGGGIENPAFVDDAINPPRVNSTFKPHNCHERDASSLNKEEEQPTEAVNLELINLKPIGGGQHQNGSVSEPYDVSNGMTTIPLKKETDRDIGNPYDEYFVPVNEHRKYMRGEKLYVTKDNRVEKSRSKFICWMICLCVVVAALIIGILAAVGIIGNQGPLPQEVSARSFDGNLTPISKGSISLPGVPDSGQSSSSPEPPISTVPAFLPTTDTSRIEVPRAIESVLKIDNLQFNSELADSNSSEFRALAETLEMEIKKSLFNRDLLQYGPADIEVKIMEFMPGSVVVKYRVVWKFKEGIHGAKDPIDPTSLKRKMAESLQKNDGLMDSFHVPEKSVSAGRIIDRCKIENDGCEHVCVFDYDRVDFACLCPQGKRLASDGKTCEDVVQGDSSVPTEYSFVHDADEVAHSRHNSNGYEIPAEIEPEFSAEPEPTAEPEPAAEPTTEVEPAGEPPVEPEPPVAETEPPVAEPSAEPEPATQPEPTAEPDPSAEPEPTAEPDPAAEPKHADTKPAAEPVAAAEPEPTANPEPAAEPESTANPAKPEPAAELITAEPEQAAKLEPAAEMVPAAEPVPTAEPEPETEQGPTEKPMLEVELEPKPVAEPEPMIEFKSATELQPVEVDITEKPETAAMREQTLVVEPKPAEEPSATELTAIPNNSTESIQQSTASEPTPVEIIESTTIPNPNKLEVTTNSPHMHILDITTLPSNDKMKIIADNDEHVVDDSIEGLEHSTSRFNHQSTHENVVMTDETPVEHTTHLTPEPENVMQGSVSPIEVNQNDFYYDPSVGLPMMMEQVETENKTEPSNELEEYSFRQNLTVPEEKNVSHKSMLDMGTEELNQAMVHDDLGVIRVVTPIAEVITTPSATVWDMQTTHLSSFDSMRNTTNIMDVITPVAEVITTHSTTIDSEHKENSLDVPIIFTSAAEVITTQETPSSNQANPQIVMYIANASETVINDIQTTQENEDRNPEAPTSSEMSFSDIRREPKIQELHMYHDYNQDSNHTADNVEHTENVHDEYMSPFLPDLENDTFINSLHSDEHFFDHHNAAVEAHENISATKPPTLEFDQLNHTNPFDNNTSDDLEVVPLDAGSIHVIPTENMTTELPTTTKANNEGLVGEVIPEDITTKMDNIDTEISTTLYNAETTTSIEDIVTTDVPTKTEDNNSTDIAIESAQDISTEPNVETTTTSQSETNEVNSEMVETTTEIHLAMEKETTTQIAFDVNTEMNLVHEEHNTMVHSGKVNHEEPLEESSTTTLAVEITTLPSEILNNVHSNSFFEKHIGIDRQDSEDEKPDDMSTTSINNFNDPSSSTEDLIALETTTNIFKTRHDENTTENKSNEATTIKEEEEIETATDIVNFGDQGTNEISTASSSPPSIYQVEEKIADLTTTEKLFVSPKPTTEKTHEEEEADLSVVPLSEKARDALNEISPEQTKEARIIRDEEENVAKPVTEDFDLPKFARCRIGQFQCVNGTSIKDGNYCITNNDRCDSVLDCSDGSDETNCEAEGCPNNFQCNSKQCLKRHLVCDGILNCNDGSDEINCENWTCKFDEISCGASQRCIPISWKCDGKSHCLDGSDEHNCHPNSCSDESFHCSEQGSCIPASWRCDGKQDCATDEDEKLCDCGTDEFKCVLGGGCIPKSNRCDGIEHCADKSDEWNCLLLEVLTNSSNTINDKKILQVQAENNTWYPVCMDWAVWNTTYADLACKNLGYAGSTSLESVPKPAELEFERVYQLRTSIGNTLQLEQKNDGECNQFASISCQEYVCGSPSTFDLVSARIIGGDKAAPSQWPSLGLLYDKKRNTYCTSTLVTPLWAIASHSCVLGNTQSAIIDNDWILYAGGANKMDNTTIQMRAIQKIITHPQAKFSEFEFINDLVLLKLRKPMIINVNVSASCLPQKDIEPRQLCIVSGWGVNQPGELTIQQYLHYLPVPMIDPGECNSTRHYNGKLSDDKICAGYTDSEKTPCFNDEGAPLMCFSEKTSNWELQGILSHHDNCGSNKHPAVYTKIDSNMRSWIVNTIGRQAFSKLL